MLQKQSSLSLSFQEETAQLPRTCSPREHSYKAAVREQNKSFVGRIKISLCRPTAYCFLYETTEGRILAVLAVHGP